MNLTIKRLLAYWLDFIILLTLLVGSQWILYLFSDGLPFIYFDSGYIIESWVLLTISTPVWLYFIMFEYYKSQTIGKRVFKIKVIADDGKKISVRQAVIRTAIKLLPWELTHIIILIPEPWWNIEIPEYSWLIYIPNALMVIYIIFLLCKRGTRSIHDYCARTLVKEVNRPGA
jgi:uncharacterized RDD family membrane protein YckC